MEQYLHTLVPADAKFVPTPEQVARFAKGLSALSAAPLKGQLILIKPTDRLRMFKDPMTGETRSTSIPVTERVTLENITDLAATLAPLQQYFVALDGEGPPALPPFTLYAEDAPFTQNYGFVVRCCLKAEPVSMSCLGGEQTGNEMPFFGQPCSRQDALFRHPFTGKLIEVANAGSARFWVEFEFGKWLLPKIVDSLNILDPAISNMAEQVFAIKFAQGFHMY